MNRLALALVAAAALTTPAFPQSLSVLLPQISFPDPVTTPSTKGCTEAPSPVCTPRD